MIHRRLLGALTALAVGTTGVVLVVSSPASAYGLRSLVPTTWAWTDSTAPHTSFVDQRSDIPVGRWLDEEENTHTSRSYFTFDLTALRGRVAHEASFAAREKLVTDCTRSAPVQLWRTAPVTSTTSWKKPPKELELLTTLSRSADQSCPGGYLTHDLTETLRAALQRGDQTLTLGLRIAASSERDKRLGRWLAALPGISLRDNGVPTVGEVGHHPSGACGTADAPVPVNRRSTEFRAQVTDPDQNDRARATFAAWPVAAPEQRVERGGLGYAGGIFRTEWDTSGYPHDTLVAWAARAEDGYDQSEWSTPCYVRVDGVAPAQAPTVTSAEYPEGRGFPGHGGPGISGTFVLDSQGEEDVTRYRVYDTSAGINEWIDVAPGTAANYTWAPRRSGSHSFEVWALDAVGNTSPVRRYEFIVRDTAPRFEVQVGGVGLPSTVTMRSPVAEVTSFGYRIDDGTEVRVPATDATASVELTFPERATYQLVVSAYVGDTLSGVRSETVHVSDAPVVESADFAFPDRPGVVGREGSFTFRPRTTEVVAYRYAFGNDEEIRIDAGPTGVATLTWTPSQGGGHALRVRSERADGALSEVERYEFSVTDPRPTVHSNDLEVWPRQDGAGVPIRFSFHSRMAEVTEFVYRFDDETELTVPAEFGRAWVTWTPQWAGEHEVTVRARYSSGELSPAAQWPFTVWSGPVVRSPQYDEISSEGRVGREATFTLRPGLPGVQRYTYRFEGGEEQTVEASADGSATLTYTPGYPGYQTLEVTGEHAGGITSETRTYAFSVKNDRVSVYGFYNEWGPQGGIGVPGWMSFHSELFPDVAEYVYRLNDGPEQTVAADPEGTSTPLTITPDRNGSNTLQVRQRLRDGHLTPPTEYTFLVGTAPLVASPEYPAGQWSGGVGIGGQFTFSGGTTGIVEFEYRIGAEPPVTVPAVDGSATVGWTPAEPGTYQMSVRGRTGEDTWTDTANYQVYVQY
ncbi:hypothetical protein ACGFIK_20690 [Micromonospora sp. NPDC048871]|uniref:hypothetical protein n=1 Tax=unclassified Micromonospora TaxID=2617518 RepID=UPI002E0F0757|nr:hypothetical protein OIE53_18680 [Micromonospora sp. NBC_01739]